MTSLDSADRLSRSRPLERAAAGGLSVLYSSALVIARSRPSVDDDAGIFLSVAARLLHGDHLYTGVWDNKAPLFYYAQAFAVAVGGWRGPFLLDIVWLAIATVSMWEALRAIGSSRWTCLVGAAVYPVMLTGSWYIAGYSELPALAIAPTIVWLSLRHHTLAAGCVFGIAFFFRTDYSLILLAATVVAVGLGAKDGGTLRRDVRRALLGLLASGSIVAAWLAVRGELMAYIGTTLSQVGYPDRALVQMGRSPGVLGHLSVVASAIAGSRLRVVLFDLVTSGMVGLAAWELGRGGRGQPVGSRERLLAGFFLATAAATAGTLAFSALWTHSLESIALAATFGTCLLVSTIETASPRPFRLMALAATGLMCCVAFGGLSIHRGGVSESSRPISAWWTRPRTVSADALNAAAAAYAPAGRVSYARLGQNTDDAHAEFIRPELALACPVFHQYPFSTNLEDALTCLRERRPELVLVGPFFSPEQMRGTEDWDAFVAAGRVYLEANYVQSVTMPSRGGTVEVWRRR